MPAKKRDNRKRILKEGESQRSDGRYMYRYIDAMGERMTIYSWRLVETDEHPAGRKKDLSLREKEAMIQRDLLDGIHGSEITMNRLFERYLKTKKSVMDATKDNYILMYDKHIKSSYLGNRMLKDICKSDILSIYEEMSDKELSNGTIQLVHNNIIFPMLQLAVDSDWIRKNPAKGCAKEYPYDVMNKREALSAEEQKKFLDFLQNDKVYGKYFPIVQFILETTLRRGEALGLTWDEIDLKNGVIHVKHQLQYRSVNGKYRFAIIEPKTETGKRIVPLSNVALNILRELKEKEYFKSIHSGICIDGYSKFVFMNHKGDNVIIPRQFGDSLIAACKKYNKKEEFCASKENRDAELLPMITPHILRHTGCTRMAEKGVDIKVLQAIMGHKKAETTMNIYNHVDLHRITQEFEKVNAEEAAYLLG